MSNLVMSENEEGRGEHLAEELGHGNTCLLKKRMKELLMKKDVVSIWLKSLFLNTVSVSWRY